MNTTDALRRLRSADPARTTPVPVTADELLTRFVAHPRAIEVPSPAVRPRRPKLVMPRRLGIAFAAAATLAIAVPALWPGSAPPASTALAVTQDGSAVHVTIPLDRRLQPEELQAALDKVGVRAAVLETSGDCTRPAQDGLPAIYDVAPPGIGQLTADPAVRRVTLFPDRMPVGTTMIFAIDRHRGGISVGWWLTAHIPSCVSSWWDEGPAVATR